MIFLVIFLSLNIGEIIYFSTGPNYELSGDLNNVKERLNGLYYNVPSERISGYPLYKQYFEFNYELNESYSKNISLHLSFYIELPNDLEKDPYLNIILILNNGDLREIGKISEGSHIFTSRFLNIDGNMLSSIKFERSRDFSRQFFVRFNYIAVKNSTE